VATEAPYFFGEKGSSTCFINRFAKDIATIMELVLSALNENLLLIYILVLATFVGMEVISNIPTILHTPLMSGSNAISGIVIIGACISILRLDPQDSFSVAYYAIGFAALVLATINVVGGFMVTDRILGMFKKKK
jgi:H+-translocating NAD(P) transhydrogenase subunit alpha